ncbi:MAG: hypothetical protein M3070_04380 [Actinomycetota bacterium]|nr:hypothetical protein [Actinomycetota bacterium]
MSRAWWLAGVSRRTFFRYFDSKTSVLWSTFDHEGSNLRETLASKSSELSVTEAISPAAAVGELHSLATEHGRVTHGALAVRVGGAQRTVRTAALIGMVYFAASPAP